MNTKDTLLALVLMFGILGGFALFTWVIIRILDAADARAERKEQKGDR